MKLIKYVVTTLALSAALPALASVMVSSPSNGDTVAANVKFVASANTTTCKSGVAALGVYIDDSLKYSAGGTSINTTLNLASGNHKAVILAWDYCGATSSSTISLTVNTASGVSVTSPANGSTVSNPAAFVASATTACAGGVASMGVYVNGNLSYTSQGAKLNATLPLPVGTPNTVVQAWDNCGGVTSTPVSVKVAGTTMANIHQSTNWNQWGELPPVYDICSAPCSGISWAMTHNQKAVSLSGNATRFDMGGSKPYSDVLWSNPVLGQGALGSYQDNSRSLIPNLHNFALDTDIFITNLAVTQDLEFDINMYKDGVGMEWGTECNHLADGVWDIWDNVNAHWVPTSIPCTLNNNAWNHVTVNVQRESDNTLLYQSITVNGVNYPINRTMPPFSVPSGWYGMTINYQMDGNYRQSANTTFLDNTNFTYW